MKLCNKKTGEIMQGLELSVVEYGFGHEWMRDWSYNSIKAFLEDWEDVKENSPVEPLIKDEKIRKAVKAWAEAENCTSEMNLYYTLNRQEKYITFHNPQTGSELQLCDFDSPVFQEIREYTIDELCGEEE